MNSRQSMGPPASQQRGAVLIVALITLLLITLITFASVRSSNTNLRIAVAQEVKVATFQAAESVVVALIQSTDNLGPPQEGSVLAFNSADGDLPTFAIRDGADDGDGNIVGNVDVDTQGWARFRREATSLGNSIRKGGAGFQTFHYDIEGRADVATGSESMSMLTQGVFVNAPRVN